MRDTSLCGAKPARWVHSLMEISVHRLSLKKGANEMNSLGKKRKTLVCIILFLFLFTPSMAVVAWADDQPAPPAEQKPPAPSFSFSTDILNQYIFRGAAQSKDSAVFQPSFTVIYSGFSASVWGNFDTARHSNNLLMPLPSGQAGNAKWSETDFTVSYTREVCPNLSLLVGNIYYGLQEPISNFDQDELFGGVSYAFPWLTVAFTTYGEVTHSSDIWFELDLSRSIPVDMLCKGATLDLGANFGYLILPHDNNNLSLAGVTPASPTAKDVGSYSDFHTAQLTADVKFPIGKYVTIAPKIAVWLPLTNAAENFLKANSLDTGSTHVVGGVNLTATF